MDALREPAFGNKRTPHPYELSQDALTSAEILEYLSHVRSNAEAFFEAVSPDAIVKDLGGAAHLTLLDNVLGQYRHVQNHIGCLNEFLSFNGAQEAGWLAYGESTS